MKIKAVPARKILSAIALGVVLIHPERLKKNRSRAVGEKRENRSF